MKKRWISVLIALMLAIVAMPVSAVCAKGANESAVNQDVQPRYLYAEEINNSLTINGTAATCYSIAKAQPGVTRIVITHYLEKKVSGSWTSIADWTKQTTSDRELTMTTGRTGLASGTYRLRTVATYYCGSASEQLEYISDSKTVS